MDLESLKKRIKFNPRTGIFDVAFKDGLVVGEVSEKKYLTVLKKNFKSMDVSILPYDYGIVSASVADVRRHPKKNSELITQALLGYTVRIMRRKKRWLLCQLPDSYIGWIEERNIISKDRKEIERWKKGAVMVVEPFSEIRFLPQEKSKTMLGAYAMSLLCPTKISRIWTEIMLPDKRRGFVLTEDLAKKRGFKRGSADDILRYACKFLETPYLWGGMTVLGMDCSGLVQVVFLANGCKLPRDADMQFDVTKKISGTRKADLLFFSENDESITHVGICMGGTQFIHASGKRKEVCINDISGDSRYEKFLSSIFVDARRVPKDF